MQCLKTLSPTVLYFSKVSVLSKQQLYYSHFKINSSYRKNLFSRKGPVQCFSMQVVMNKCFLLNPEKIWRRSVCRFREKTKST